MPGGSGGSGKHGTDEHQMLGINGVTLYGNLLQFAIENGHRNSEFSD
jgi:hypothetical protein